MNRATPSSAGRPDAPIGYMARTRAYYLALGYDTPYVWAHHEDVPFAPLQRPLAASRVALVTTAAPFQPDKGPQGPGAPYNAAAKFHAVYSGDTARDHDLRIAHVAIDRAHTHMRDSGSWFPLSPMRRLAAQGVFLMAPRFHGFPTNRSRRHTLETDAPALYARCIADGVDAALLVANCPVCHQSLSLAARYLEQRGIATAVLGCARDIVEYCGVPRLLFSDFPLGNAAGPPHDPEGQRLTVELALRLLQEAAAPRTTWQSPLVWAGAGANTENAGGLHAGRGEYDWKQDYANAQRLSPERLAALRAEAEAARLVARADRIAAIADAPACVVEGGGARAALSLPRFRSPLCRCRFYDCFTF